MTVLLCAAEAVGSHSGPGARSAGETVLGVGLGLMAGLTYALMPWAAHRLLLAGHLEELLPGRPEEARARTGPELRRSSSGA